MFSYDIQEAADTSDTSGGGARGQGVDGSASTGVRGGDLCLPH